MDLNIQSGKYNVPEKFFIAYKKYKTPKMLALPAIVWVKRDRDPVHLGENILRSRSSARS